MKNLEIFKLFGSIFIDNEKANKSIDATDKKGKGVAGTLGKMAGTAAKWGAGIAIGAGVAFGGMTALANKTAGATDRIDKLSQRLGMSRQGFQEWEFVLSQSGSSMESLQSGMKVMVQKMADLEKGTGKGAEAFGKLGIKFDDIKDLSQEDIFKLTVERFNEMEDGAGKAALAQDLFSRSGQELLPLLNANSGAVGEMTKQAHELGLVLNDEAIDAGVKYTDTMDQMKRAVGALFTKVGTDLIPIMQSFSAWIIANMPAIQAKIETAFNIANALVDGFAKVINFARENADWLIPVVVGLVSAITTMQIIGTIINLINMWKASTIAQTLAQGGLNAVLLANPIGLVIAAIGLLVAAGVALYMHWDVVKEKAKIFLDYIKEKFSDFKESVIGVFNDVKSFVLDIWDRVVGKIQESVDKIKKIIQNVLDIYQNAKNKVSGFASGAKDKMSSVVNSIGGFISDAIPGLATGGEVQTAGRVLVGERGPEFLDLPAGARVTPLNHTSSQGGVTFGRGAFEGVMIMDDYGVDRFMDRVMERLTVMGVR